MCHLIARYGFQPGETGNARDDYRVVDESYTRQIPSVPQVTSGCGMCVAQAERAAAAMAY